MLLKDLFIAGRSYRRFDESYSIDRETLKELVDLARVSPSGGNCQPLKYILSDDPDTNTKIFSCLKWAAALSDWSGPDKGERPSAYIVILNDTEIPSKGGVDHGIAAHSIIIGATEKGLGGCILGSVNREVLQKTLNISEKYEIRLVVALGKPAEKVILEDIKPGGDTKYYRDANDIHHVPKRTLEEIIVL